MEGTEFKASEKTVLKISRNGALEVNLSSGSETRVSGKVEDAVLRQKNPDDELLGSHEKPQDTAEKPKKRKPSFIDAQQQEASKLQPDYVTQRTQTPLNFETSPVSDEKQAVTLQPADNSAVPEQASDDKQSERAETQKSADSRNDSSDLSETPEDHYSEVYGD